MGASSHITKSVNRLKNIKPVTNWCVVLPNNLRLQATHLGDIHFTDNFVLTNVSFVPAFHYNLLSATKLSKNLNCELVFSSDKCAI